MFVIKRTDQGCGWVADLNKTPSGVSYTFYLQRAKMFRTREEAEKDRCVDNEIIQTLEEAANVQR